MKAIPERVANRAGSNESADACNQIRCLHAAACLPHLCRPAGERPPFERDGLRDVRRR